MLPLLSSLALQQTVDFNEFGMIVVFDGDEAAPLPEEEWQAKYPFQIQFLHVKHGGVSAARNAGLDAATADYIMFCDADDMFSHMCGIYLIFREIDKGEFDTMASLFSEETRHPETGEPVFVMHPKDSTFVHGKVHRRKYLIDNDIRFNPKLTIHEDSYFNTLAQNLSHDPAKVMYCPTEFYLWRWRDNSVCRKDPKYLLKTYPMLIDSNDAMVDEFERRGKPDKARFYFGCMMYDIYYTMQKREWIDPANLEYREATNRRAKKYYLKHKAKWDAMTYKDHMQTSNGVRTRCVNEGMPMESITIVQWLQYICNLGE